MKNFTVELLRIGNIAGMFYSVPKHKTSRIVVYALGAPIPPDSGALPDAPFILDFDTDVFVIDYIGYGRSEGTFTPQNCIKTMLTLYKNFTEGCVGKSGYKNIEIPMKYKEIYFVGRSFGGAYVPLLPRFNKKIENLCLIYPVVDYTACGKIVGEETLVGFMKAMTVDGYKYLYRGITNPIWEKHFKNADGLSPIDNITYLKNTKLFIGHGKTDKNINYVNSKNYYDNVVKTFPEKKAQYKLNLYDGDHSYKTSNSAITDYLTWMKVPKRKI